MIDPKKKAEEIRKARALVEDASSASSPISGGLPGWSYYLTFPQTPARVTIDLRRGGWEEAGPEHAQVKHASAAGMPAGTYTLWVKPTELVNEDLNQEAARRPKPRPLTAAFGV